MAGKKMYCVSPEAMIGFLTLNKKYEILDEHKYSYVVVTDLGFRCEFDKSRFDIFPRFNLF